MAYQSFEELDVWKRACALAVDVYHALRESNDFGLRDQMQRAAISIPSNIAAKIGAIDKESMKRFVSETKQLSNMLYALANSLKDRRKKTEN